MRELIAARGFACACHLKLVLRGQSSKPESLIHLVHLSDIPPQELDPDFGDRKRRINRPLAQPAIDTTRSEFHRRTTFHPL
jgi:hypothetical protein